MNYKVDPSRVNLFLFKTIQIILSLLGLSPQRLIIQVLSSPKSDFSLKFSCSRQGSMYNIVLIIILIMASIMIYPGVIDDPVNSTLLLRFNMILTIIGNLFASITILVHCLYQRSVVSTGNQLSAFNRKFPVDFSLQHVSKLRNLHFFVVIVCFWSCCVRVITSSFRLYVLFSTISFVVSLFISSSGILQYSSVIEVLREIAKGVNETLQDMEKCSMMSDELPVLSHFENKRILQHFGMIRRARNALFKVSGKICQFYGVPILLNVFYNCCCCVDSLYFIIDQYIIEGQFDSTLHFLGGSVWIVLAVYPIVILTETVKGFNAEMERTAEVAYDVKESHAGNKVIGTELNEFAVELLHKKVVFTAHGFFPLDCTLLYSIFGMIVTYLIILLQFSPKW